MGMGPVFECPDNLLERLPEVCAARSVRVEMVKEIEITANAHPYVIYCIFKGRLGRIDGRLSSGGQARKMWLTFPRAYALNPLLWPVNFRLSKRIEGLLAENGARRCNWDDGENSF
jgi:hypothetical protein